MVFAQTPPTFGTLFMELVFFDDQENEGIAIAMSSL
jgi:hypothetical protein